MDTKLALGIGFVILASLTTQLPHVIFRHQNKMTGRELAENYPALAWIRFTYPILSIIWFLVFGVAPIFLMINFTFDAILPFQLVLFILGAAIGSLSILHGGLALITNVCPLPQKQNRKYVYEEEMRTNALLMISTGIFMVIIALAMIYYNVSFST